MSVYLVVEPIRIIANDLALCIQEYDRDAEVIVATSPDEARVAVVGGDSVQVAFLHMDLETFSAGPLADVLAASATVCVFMGGAAERVRDARYLLLERPFSSEMVANLLARIMPRDRARA
jgi:hypothetical protein